MATAVHVTIPEPPGVLAKNRARIVFPGKRGKCSKCGKSLGQPFIVEGKLPAGVGKAIEGQAFSAGVKASDGMVMVAMVAHWPTKWGPKGRAEGRPRGDVDAPVSGVLDALAGVLYNDDAQVALLIAANAKTAKGQERIEVSVAPLSARLLADIERETGLSFTTATLSTGQQGTL